MDKRLEQTLHQRGYVYGKKHMTRYSTSLAIRKMESKTTIRYHCKPIRMAKIKTTEHTKC